MPGKWDANDFHLSLCFLKLQGYNPWHNCKEEVQQIVPWQAIVVVPAYAPYRAAICTRGCCSSALPPLGQACGMRMY